MPEFKRVHEDSVRAVFFNEVGGPIEAYGSPDQTICPKCRRHRRVHGRVGDLIVCPWDVVVFEDDGAIAMKPEEFMELYVPSEDNPGGAEMIKHMRYIMGEDEESEDEESEEEEPEETKVEEETETEETEEEDESESDTPSDGDERA